MGIDLLPEYRNVEVVARARDYLVAGKRHQRVTTALGIINKPALIPWAKRLALEKVRETLLNKEVRNEVLNMGFNEGEMGLDIDYEGFVDRLVDTANKRPDEVRDASAALGTEAHALVRDATLLTTAEERYEFRNMVGHEQLPAYDGALAFLRDHEIEVADTERTVWDSTFGIAGTVDGIGYRSGLTRRLVIWDWKRSAGIYWETALQLAAYAHCLEHLTGLRVVEAYAVRLLRQPAKEGEPLYESKRVEDLGEAFEAYLHAMNLQRAGNRKDWWEERV